MSGSPEQSEVHFGRSAIPYAIVRGQRQKTVAIAVDPLYGVRVRAPRDTPVAKLDRIVHAKAQWILERRRALEDLPPPPSPREFVSGETFLYLGRQYRLKVDGRLAADAGVRLVAGQLRVSRKTDAREALVAWYRDRAADRIPRRVAHWAELLDASPGSVLIRDPRKRWGSADAKGNLRFNWRIIQAPTRLVDYVVAHELAHLRYPNHTSQFWALVGTAIPDFDLRREALRRLGIGLVW